MTEEQVIDEKLISSLNKICCDLITILRKSETILSVEKQKYQRVTDVCKPWPIKKTKSSEQNLNLRCTCSETTNSCCESKGENSDTLVDSIPLIVNQAKALRISPYSSSNTSNMTKYTNAKKCIRETIISSKTDTLKLDKSKSKLLVNKKSTSFQSLTIKATRSIHDPSCSLYGSSVTDLNKTNSISSLSDAISLYGIPEKLHRTLNDYHKFILRNNEQDIIMMKSINTFLKCFNRQSDETWRTIEENVEKMPKYMLALNSIEKSSSLNQSYVPCIIYHNVEDLAVLEKCKNELHEKEMWHDILRYLNRDFTSILLQCNLTKNEKIYICKILHAVCNFSSTRVPKIPLYRVKNS